MTEVENLIYQFDENQREMMLCFHNLLTNKLNLVDKIRFKIPFYYGKSWICYLNPIKGSKVELVFIWGKELSNHRGLLNDKGRKQVSGIEFEKVSDISIEYLNEIIQEAILLDEIKAQKLKKKSKK